MVKADGEPDPAGRYRRCGRTSRSRKEQTMANKTITCGTSFFRSAPAAGAAVSLRSSFGTELGVLQPNDGIDRKVADVWATLVERGSYRLEPKTLLGELYLSTLVAGVEL